jgi:hypothetical protein
MLIEANAIGGAGLDVFEHEPAVNPKLLGSDRVVAAACRTWARPRSRAASTWARRSSSTSRPSPTATLPPMIARAQRRQAHVRHDVFRTLATRLTTVMHVLEQVAFAPIDARLAQALLDRAGASSIVEATHSDLARQIGSAREVVSRRLETWRAKGLITLERGQIAIVDRPAVARLSD